MLRSTSLAALLVLGIVLAYRPAWKAGFIWDDDVYVVNNQLLTAPDGLQRIWFSLDSPSQYFPLTYTTFRFERSLWGLHAARYHWDNILLHALNALLVWRLLRRLSVPGSWLAAALFALHPVQVESVAWITERKNVLSLLFCLLTVRAWVEFTETKPRRRWWFYASALLLGALALCAKTTACTLPAALVLVLWLKATPLEWRRLLPIVPFVLMSVAAGFLAIWWERYHQGTLGEQFSMGLLSRLLVASRAIWFYPSKLIWPVNLAFSYPRWTISPTDPLAYVWFLLCLGAAVAIRWTRHRWGRGVQVATLFYVLTLVPMLGLIMLYTFRYTYVADHYQYVASIGPLALAAAALTRWLKPGVSAPPWWQLASCGYLLLALGILTRHQCAIYADLNTLWRDTLKKNPSSTLALVNFGVEIEKEGRFSEAIDDFQKCLRIDSRDVEAYNDLGYLLLRKGQVDEAMTQLRTALKIQPNDAGTRNNLATALLQKGLLDEALAQFQKALELRPGNAAARYNVGMLLIHKRRLSEGIEQLEKYLKSQPQDVGAALTLAWVLATCPEDAIRNGPKALQFAQQAAYAAGGDHANVWATLAAAYAELGQFSEAQQSASHALDTVDNMDAAQKDALRSQLALYRSGAPFRDTNLAAIPLTADKP